MFKHFHLPQLLKIALLLWLTALVILNWNCLGIAVGRTNGFGLSRVRAALFHGGEEFHFLDGDDKLVTFSASKTKQCEEYRLSSYDKSAKDAFKLHSTISKNHFQLQDKKRKLGLLLEELRVFFYQLGPSLKDLLLRI